ncbi:Smr/MutS family protein [Endozoicomonas ascidiicola]|uniref:Smr/MutS family protein n=1 Tax=Endozoicomonas ascidiicola TaxID=1698521 RepID=UPI000AC3A146|nr:Smr/MutS family protein [Endozoicomonas ascidiicola]
MCKNDDEEQSFEQAMKGVKPLKNKNIKAQIGKQLPKKVSVPESTLQARRKAAQQLQSSGGAALSEAWVEPIEPEQSVAFSRDGIQHNRMRQLRQGMIPIQFELDLHGYKIDEARELISEFIQIARLRGVTCVRVVHGKSHRTKDRQSTLKSHTNHWLKQMSDVLAFCSAPASEGGTGSVLVLLKKR